MVEPCSFRASGESSGAPKSLLLEVVMSKEEKEGPRIVIRVGAGPHESIEKWAGRRGITAGEAADLLISVGDTRMEAVARYGAKSKKDAQPRAPRAKKTKTKASAKKKSKKAPASPAAAETSPSLPGEPAGDLDPFDDEVPAVLDPFDDEDT